MEIKRTTEIFVETKRRFVIEPLETTLETVVCPQCAAPMIQAEQIARLLGISRRSVYQTIERGAWHYVETGDGFLYICTQTFGNNSKTVADERQSVTDAS